jgi:hypothetical protein
MKELPFDELANAVIDGVASPEERAALQAWLDRDPAARQRFQTLELAVRALARVPKAEAPADLRREIMKAVRKEPALRPSRPPLQVTTTPWRSWSDVMSRALGLRLAAAFAAGIAAGAIVFTLATGGRPMGGGPATGTMAPPEIEGVLLTAGPARAVVDGTPVRDQLALRISVTSTSPASFEVTWAGDSSFDGFERIEGLVTSVNAAPGRVALELQGPSFQGVIRLRGTPAPTQLLIRLRSTNNMDERSLAVPTSGGDR